jgi:hypothetical protein
VSLRDDILAADDLPREPLVVPEWSGKTVFIRTLSGTERDAFEASNVKQKGRTAEFSRANLRARLAVLVVCDSEGKRIFGDDDASALGRKSGAALDRIFDVANRLNRLSEQAAEDAEKN